MCPLCPLSVYAKVTGSPYISSENSNLYYVYGYASRARGGKKLVHIYHFVTFVVSKLKESIKSTDLRWCQDYHGGSSPSRTASATEVEPRLKTIDFEFCANQ